MPLVTTWIDPKDITLNEISQRKTNRIQSHLYAESKKQKNHTKKKQTKKDLMDTENGLVVARGWGRE